MLVTRSVLESAVALVVESSTEFAWWCLRPPVAVLLAPAGGRRFECRAAPYIEVGAVSEEARWAGLAAIATWFVRLPVAMLIAPSGVRQFECGAALSLEVSPPSEVSRWFEWLVIAAWVAPSEVQRAERKASPSEIMLVPGGWVCQLVQLR